MTRRGWVLFASMCVIWGLPYLMIRVAVRELTPATLVFARTAIAALVLLPIAARRDELRPLARYWRPLVVFTVVEIAIPWLFLASAEQHLSSSLTGLLIAAVPLVGAAMVAASGGGEALGPRRLAGLLVGIVGVAALVGLDVSGASVWPLLEMAVVVVCYALGPILLARTLGGLPALGISAAALALTAVAYAPIAVFQLPDARPSASVVASVLGLALICTAAAFLIFFGLISEVGPVRATVFTYVNPAVAAILGVLVLDEAFTTGMAVGFALVLAGSVLATTRGGAPAAREPAAAAVAEP